MAKWLAFLSITFLYFFNLGLNQVWQPNEAFYADASKNMLKTGDFLTPIYNGELRLNKPPMTYWLTALSFFLFGINEFALRFFQALAGLGTGLLTYLMARRLAGELPAIYAFLALTLSFQFIANARYTSPEVLLTFFTTLSLYLWHLSYEKKSNPLFFLALTASVFGVLTKGPVGFLMPAGIIFVYLLIRDWRELLKIKYYLGTIYVLLASGWWFIYQYLTHREEFLKVFVKENIRRIYALQEDPIYFYLLDINVSFLPYSFVFYVALIWIFKNKRKELLFPLVWFLTVFVAFSLVKMKIPVYVMPAFPAMAILTGVFLSEVRNSKPLALLFTFLALLMATAVVVGAVIFKVSLIFLLLSLLPVAFVLYRRQFALAPAVAGFGLLLYLAGVLLPMVEEKRPYREIGSKIKEIDPSGVFRTYELGSFHHNLPFYADRVIIRNAKPHEVKKPAIVLVREDLMDCPPVASWSLYRGSESRFFKFLMDIKKNRRFYDFKLCILKSPM